MKPLAPRPTLRLDWSRERTLATEILHLDRRIAMKFHRLRGYADGCRKQAVAITAAVPGERSAAAAARALAAAKLNRLRRRRLSWEIRRAWIALRLFLRAVARAAARLAVAAAVGTVQGVVKLGRNIAHGVKVAVSWILGDDDE